MARGELYLQRILFFLQQSPAMRRIHLISKLRHVSDADLQGEGSTESA